MKAILFAALLIAAKTSNATDPTPAAIPPAITPSASTTDQDLDGANLSIDTSSKRIRTDDNVISANRNNRDVQSQQTVAQAQQDRGQQVQNIVDVGDAHPQSAPINIKAGQALVSVGEAPRSLPLIDRAITIAQAKGDNNTLGQALFARAAADAALHDYPSIVKDAKRVLDFDPSNQQAQMLVSLYAGRVAGHGGGDIKTGMDGGQNGPGADSQAGAAECASGNALMNSGGFGGIMTPLGVRSQTASQLEAARLVNLAAQKAALDAAAAKSLLDQALAADPKNVAGLVARARLERAEKDFSASLSDADNAAKLAPKLGEAYWLRAEAKKGLGRTTQDVAVDYAMAGELDPTLTSGEVGALAQGGATSSFANQAVAARAKAISGIPALDAALSFMPPERRKPVALGLAGLIAAALAFLALRRFIRPSA